MTREERTQAGASALYVAMDSFEKDVRVDQLTQEEHLYLARVVLTAALGDAVEAWAVTQGGEIVSLWITEEAAVKVMASYRRSIKGPKWDVEPITLTRAVTRHGRDTATDGGAK